MPHRALLPAALLLASCAEIDTERMFNRFELNTPTEATAANQAFTDLADAATTELRVALPTLTDPDLADAILAAHVRGVDVEVVTDVDQADDAGIVTLLDGGVPVQLADDAMTYFEFTLNDDVSWTSDQIHMTHAFAVADLTEVVFANHAGDLVDGPRIVFAGHSENLGQDLLTEHTQLFGGADATATTAFDAMAKSVADNRWLYPSQNAEQVEVWLGPQERVAKRLIDGIFQAKANTIKLMSEDISDEGILVALKSKAADGFEIEILVGPSFGTTNAALSQRLLDLDEITVLQSTGTAALPTVLYLDYDEAPDGRYHLPTAMIATHPFYSAARLFNEVEVVTDQLTDGALYEVSVSGEPTAWLQQLAGIYQDAVDAGTQEVQ